MADVLDDLAPARWDHEILIGDTYQCTVELIDEDTGAALDLSAVTAGVVKVRAEPGGKVLLTPTVDLTDKASGVVSWASPATDTDDLSPGSAVYALQLTSGIVRTVLEGRILIRRGAVT